MDLHRRIDSLVADLCAMVEDGELERAEYALPDLDEALKRHCHAEEGRPELHADHLKMEGWLDELRRSLTLFQRPQASTALAELVEVIGEHERKA
jgi:hypothetical protein